MPPQQSERDQLLQTVEKLRSELVKQKRRLEKASRKETELETLLLSSEGDIEGLRARLAACELQREQQHAQLQKFNAALKLKHQSELNELKQSNAQLLSKLQQGPSQKQFHTLEATLREKVRQLEQLSKQTDEISDLGERHSLQLKQKDVLLLGARQQLSACEQQLHQYEKQLASVISQSKEETRHFEALFAEKDILFDEFKAEHQQKILTAAEEQQALQERLQITMDELSSRPSAEEYKSIETDLLRTTNDLRSIRKDYDSLQSRNESLEKRHSKEMEGHEQKDLQLQKSSNALDQLRQDFSNLCSEAESLKVKSHEQQKQIMEQEKTINESRELLDEANSQSAAMKDNFEKNNQAFREKVAELLTELEETKALVNQRPGPEEFKNMAAELNAKSTNLKQLEADLVKVREEAAALKKTSTQQNITIKDKQSFIQSLEQQLSQSRDEMIAMKSEFNSQLDISRTEKTKLESQLQVIKEELSIRPRQEDYHQMKSVMEQNMNAVNGLRGSNENMQRQLYALQANNESQQLELDEKRNLLVEAKRELIECEQRIAAQESRHSIDRQRIGDTLSEKDSLISELKTQLHEHRETLSRTTAAFKTERERLESSLSETREQASLEVKEFEENQKRLAHELVSMKTQLESFRKDNEQMLNQLDSAKRTIVVKETDLASLRLDKEKFQEETKELFAKVTLLKSKLSESDKLIDEASKASEKVVQIQSNVHKKEVMQLRADISGAKSARDMCATLLRRIVHRIKQVCAICADNEIPPTIDIDESKSVSELQIIANTFIVSIEKYLQHAIHIQSELEEHKAREGKLNHSISALETENGELEVVISECRRTIDEKDSTIRNISGKLSDLERVAVGYKLVSEESEKRLQDQEEAAEVALTSLAEELRRKEDECEQYQVAKKAAETKVDQLNGHLQLKERLEMQVIAIRKEHSQELKDVKLRVEKLDFEKAELAEKLKQTSYEMADARSSLQAISEARDQLQNKCNDLETERMTILAARSSMEVKNHELEVEVKEANEKIQSLSSEVTEKTSLYATAIATNESRLQELEVLQVELKSLTEARNALRLEVSNSSKELQAAQEALHHSNENLNKSQAEISALSSREQVTGTTILDLQNLLRSLSEEKTELDARAKQLEKEIDQLNSERCEAVNEVDKVKESLHSLTELNDSLRQSVAQLEGELEDMRVLNRNQNEVISNLEYNVRAKEKETKDSSSRQAELEEKISRLESDIRNSEQLFEDQKLSLRAAFEEEKKTETARMDEEFTETFRKASEQADRTVHELRSEINSLEERLRSQAAVLAADRDDLRRELAGKVAELNNLHRKHDSIAADHHLVVKEKEELERELEQSRLAFNMKKSEVQELLDNLSEKDERLKDANEKYKSAAESIETLESKLSQMQNTLSESQARFRDEQSLLEEKLREMVEKISELERILESSESASAQRLAELGELHSAKVHTMEEDSHSLQHEIARLLEVETELKAEITSLSHTLHETEGKLADSQKCFVEQEGLAKKHLMEVERLNSIIIPPLEDRIRSSQEEVERLSKDFSSRTEQWQCANSSVTADHERTSRHLEEVRQNLRQSEDTILARDRTIERLKLEHQEATTQLEKVQVKLDEIVRLRNDDAKHLHQKIEVYEKDATECDLRLRLKEEELANFETILQETREKCLRVEEEKEAMRLSVAESQDNLGELSELQRVHEKLLIKVVKLQRRARRAEMLLQHEKKKHAVIAKKLEVETKRQVSPSTKGLSPAMKRPRAHSLRPPLSPRDGNSRPPIMPKAHHARRSLDFGA